VVLRVLESQIKEASSVLVLLGCDCACSETWQDVVKHSEEDAFVEDTPTMVAIRTRGCILFRASRK